MSAQDYLTALTEGTGGDDAADGAGGSPRKAAAKAAAEAATTPAGLTALGDGEMGELVVYRSGAVRLRALAWRSRTGARRVVPRRANLRARDHCPS